MGVKITGAWLLANDLKQMSDCTGGHKVMQFDTANRDIVAVLNKKQIWQNIKEEIWCH